MATAPLFNPRNHCSFSSSPLVHLRNGALGSSSAPASSLVAFHGRTNKRKSATIRIQVMGSTRGNVGTFKTISEVKKEPDHLLVLVHGILASPMEWTYVETELKKRLGGKFLIYASSSNMFTKTFSGIDGAGRRLADEVLQVVRRTESLKRISFVAHSLGGLFARYAIAILYSSSESLGGEPDDGTTHINANEEIFKSSLNTVAGLEPINFITLATPHLGVGGKNQLPLLSGVPILENLAPPIASIFIGLTGSQLFLTDGRPCLPPLLLRMSSDCEEGKYISALGAFQCRVVYANASNDYVVGWRTSSIRREIELSKTPQRSLKGYKHIVNVEYCSPVSSNNSNFFRASAKVKEAAQTLIRAQDSAEYHAIIEEEMIKGLHRVGWKKVDVSFHTTFLPFLAHNHIHVKDEFWNIAGTGVVAHIVDSIKQQESLSFTTATSKCTSNGD